METLPKRKNIRLKGYDYRHPGEYFVTIVTQNRLPLFGQVDNDEMRLSRCGQMVRDTILQIPMLFDETDVVHYVVMPNHIHILFAKRETKDSLADIVKWLKGLTTHRYADSADCGLREQFRSHRLWQRNYYEHIVRNQRAHDYIAQYIHDNPMRWHRDALNAECVSPEHIMKTVLSFGNAPARDAEAMTPKHDTIQ